MDEEAGQGEWQDGSGERDQVQAALGRPARAGTPPQAAAQCVSGLQAAAPGRQQRALPRGEERPQLPCTRANDLKENGAGFAAAGSRRAGLPAASAARRGCTGDLSACRIRPVPIGRVLRRPAGAPTPTRNSHARQPRRAWWGGEEEHEPVPARLPHSVPRRVDLAGGAQGGGACGSRGLGRQQRAQLTPESRLGTRWIWWLFGSGFSLWLLRFAPTTIATPAAPARAPAS